MNDFLIQCIGGLGVLSFVISYQIKSIKKLFICQTLANVFFAVQFILLGGYTGCIAIFLIIVRNILMANYDSYDWIQKGRWVYVLIGLAAVSLFFTWSGPLSLLPFAAFTGGTVLYATNNSGKVRLANLVCCCPCWLCYDFFIHSYTGMLNEFIMIGSILVSIYRYGWKNLMHNYFGK